MSDNKFIERFGPPGIARMDIPRFPNKTRKNILNPENHYNASIS